MEDVGDEINFRCKVPSCRNEYRTEIRETFFFNFQIEKFLEKNGLMSLKKIVQNKFNMIYKHIYIFVRFTSKTVLFLVHC